MSALPHSSDVDLLRYGKRIIDLDSEIADCTLDLCAAQQQLNRSKVSGFLIDQSCLGPAERMCPIQACIQTNHSKPFS